MIFDELSFHDATILEVKEDTASQTLDFLLDFPSDRENNIFIKRVLRRKGAIFYIKKEIPFLGSPAILEIKQHKSARHTYTLPDGITWGSEHKIEIVTNAGSRFVEFNEAELIDAL